MKKEELIKFFTWYEKNVNGWPIPYEIADDYLSSPPDDGGEICELREWEGGDETNLCDCGKGEGYCNREKADRFKMPSTETLVEFAIMVGGEDGMIRKSEIANMVAMCQLILDRLYDNNDVMKKSSKE